MHRPLHWPQIQRMLSLYIFLVATILWFAVIVVLSFVLSFRLAPWLTPLMAILGGAGSTVAAAIAAGNTLDRDE